jgi:hypothetical protein
MQTITTIGLDVAKSVLQVHGIDAKGKVLIRRKPPVKAVLARVREMPLTSRSERWIGFGTADDKGSTRIN